MKCFLCNRKVKKVIANKLRNGQKKRVYFCEHCELGILSPRNSKKKFKSEIKVKDTNIIKPDEIVALLKSYQNKQSNIAIINGTKELTDKLQPLFGKIITTYDNKLKYDVICIFKEICYQTNPLKFIQFVIQQLKEKGILLVNVSNFYNLLNSSFNLKKYSQFYFHKEHLWYFTSNSLIQLMAKVNCHGRIIYTNNYNIINHFNWLIKDRPQRQIEDTIYINLPLKETITKDRKKILFDFYNYIDNLYQDLLKYLGATSHLYFIGRKK